MGANIKILTINKTKHEDEISRISRNFFKNNDLGGQSFNSCDHGTYFTGGSAPAHSHENLHEIFYFIRGTGIFYLDGKEIEIKAGSTVNVPPNTVHEIKNTGDDILQHTVCSIIVS